VGSEQWAVGLRATANRQPPTGNRQPLKIASCHS